MWKALKYAAAGGSAVRAHASGAGRDAGRYAGDRQADRRPHLARPRRSLRAFGHRGPRQHLRPHHAVRAHRRRTSSSQASPKASTVSDDGKTFTFKIRAGPDLRFGQPGHRRRRSLVAAARDQAREDPGVPAVPARLDQGQRRHDGHCARRLDARGQDRRRFRADPGLRAARLGRRLGRRQQGRDGARSRWRHGQWLAQEQFGRLGRLHRPFVDTQRVRRARGQPELSRRRRRR